jgi:hypothetical protein
MKILLKRKMNTFIHAVTNRNEISPFNEIEMDEILKKFFLRKSVKLIMASI